MLGTVQKAIQQIWNSYVSLMYGFLIVNFCVTASVWVIYSRAVKSRVTELEERTNKHTSQADPTQPGKKLFKAYFGHNLLSESMAVRNGPNRLAARQPDVARSFYNPKLKQSDRVCSQDISSSNL